MSEFQNIEDLLKKAPRLEPPEALGQRLLETCSVPRPISLKERIAWSWKRFIPAGAFLLVAVTLVTAGIIQEVQIKDLMEESRDLRRKVEVSSTENGSIEQKQAQNRMMAGVVRDNEELRNLQKELEQLRLEAKTFPLLQAELKKLESEKRAASGLPADAHNPFETARNSAMKNACIANLKQIGVAGIQFSDKNKQAFPATIKFMQDWMKGVPVCPLAKSNQPRKYEEIDETTYSYYLLSPGITPKDKQQPFVACRFHSHFVRFDGSIHDPEDSFQ